MAWDLESLGGGAGAGVIGSVLTVLGVYKRVTRIEDGKQDKGICETKHQSLGDEMRFMRESVDRLTGRIDSLINGRRD